MTPAVAEYARRVVPPPISQKHRGLDFFSIACLLAVTPCDSPQEWRQRLEVLFRARGEAKTLARLQYLRERGYLRDGLPRVGFLTELGRSTLERHR